MVQIWGIVNVSGDSFSEGAASGPSTGCMRAEALLAAGADVLDLGAESTRPGAEEVSPELELERLLPLVRFLRSRHPEAVLSVDTRHAETARQVLALGVGIINDVSMLRFDPRMAAEVARYGARLLLCHSRGTPQDMRNPDLLDYGGDVVGGVKLELREAAASAQRAGVAPENLIFDPGFGFAKSLEQQLELLLRIGEFRELGPVLAGVSRKSWIGAVCGRSDAQQRLGGTLAAELELAERGVDMLRTHAVRELHDALVMQQAIRRQEEKYA